MPWVPMAPGGNEEIDLEHQWREQWRITGMRRIKMRLLFLHFD